MEEGSKNFKLKNYLVVKKMSSDLKMQLPIVNAVCFCLLLLLFTSCTELEKPKVETFYSETKPPAKQEFRWSNGKMPKSFDPALASAPPETDIVRAIYDGLTEVDTKSLKAIPAIAQKWSSSDDYKIWTFKLRQDAKWSNGEKITAKDFVDSWKRLDELGEKVKHHQLLNNIVGTKGKDFETQNDSEDVFSSDQDQSKESDKKQTEEVQGETEKKVDNLVKQENPVTNKTSVFEDEKKIPNETKNKKEKPSELGVRAIGRYSFEVSLINPDKEFPSLVSHPVFRAVYAKGKDFDDKELKADIVTSGAFRIFSVGKDGITLDRAEHYYDKENIKLDRVRFVPTENAEGALSAYRNGEIDAVTNADFEPLALKILTPFDDFQRTVHSALNFYEFNRKAEPFNDRRVRKALAISIDRNRLTEDEMEGATTPAMNFLPFEENKNKENLEQEIDKAKELLKTAGFPNGEGFPKVKLVVNRNNVQQRIAKSVAKMWKDNLNVETEVIVKEIDELETAKKDGNYDMLRRGVVLPTSNETANMLALFPPKFVAKDKKEEMNTEGKTSDKTQNTNSNVVVLKNSNTNISVNSNKNQANNNFENELLIEIGDNEKIILTEEEAIIEVPAIPLYFSKSYSLVKPYVQGFEMNTLDAPLLKNVQINNNWQPKKTNKES